MTKKIIGYDANSLYLDGLGDVMPCSKDALVVNKKPFEQKIAKFSKDILKEKNFLGWRRLILRYLTSFVTNLVKWHQAFVPNISDCNILEAMKVYKEENWHKNSPRKHVLGLTRSFCT